MSLDPKLNEMTHQHNFLKLIKASRLVAQSILKLIVGFVIVDFRGVTRRLCVYPRSPVIRMDNFHSVKVQLWPSG